MIENAVLVFFKKYIKNDGASLLLISRNIEVSQYYVARKSNLNDDNHLSVFFNTAENAILEFNMITAKYSEQSSYFNLDTATIINWLKTYKSEIICTNLTGCKIMLSRGVSLYRIDITAERDLLKSTEGSSFNRVNGITNKQEIQFQYPFSTPIYYSFPDINFNFNTKESEIMLVVLYQLYHHNALKVESIFNIFSKEELFVFIRTKDFKNFILYLVFNVIDKNIDGFQSPAFERILSKIKIGNSKYELLNLSYAFLMSLNGAIKEVNIENSPIKLLAKKIERRSSIDYFQPFINKYFEIQDGEFILFAAMQQQLKLVEKYLYNYKDLPHLFLSMVEESDAEAIKLRKELVGEMPLNLIDRPTNVKVDTDTTKRIYKPEASSLYDSAIIKLKTEDYVGAVIDFEKSIVQDPFLLYSYLTLTTLKINMFQDYEYVVTLINSFFELEGYEKNQDPLYASLYFNRGLANSYLEKESDAIIDFTSSLEINEQLIECYGSRAVSLMQLGDSDSAIIDFNKAIELNPEDTIAYFNRSKCKQSLGDFNGSYDDCMIAYDQDSFNPSVLEHKLFLEGLKRSDLWDVLNTQRDCE